MLFAGSYSFSTDNYAFYNNSRKSSNAKLNRNEPPGKRSEPDNIQNEKISEKKEKNISLLTQVIYR